jgi:hypothetical protein
MPTGTTKVTLFGGVSLTPGGTQTFNAPGTWTAPVGITSVNVNGSGGSGNPGNTGNTGGGGAGGAGGTGGDVPGSYTRKTVAGGNGVGFPAGSSGSAGNPGSSPTSSAFGYNFPGGAAGNGGTGGTVGSAGNSGASAPSSSTSMPGNPGSSMGNPGGAGGTPGGGSGSNSWKSKGTWFCQVGGGTYTYRAAYGGCGGGGAGTINPGTNAPNLQLTFPDGGNPGGGQGAGLGYICITSFTGEPGTPAYCNVVTTRNANSFNPNGSASRAGGAGGGGAAAMNGNTVNCCIGYYGAGGGGGGGRGNAGNPGGSGNAGGAASPTTVNAVPVTSGSSYAVTANGPVTVSWNPQ